MSESETKRKDYKPPTLKVYGDAATLTQSGGGNTSDKGGSTKHRTT
jgi:hypothetical protein